MASSLSSALSSMEVMLDALMQRGIGKPEEKIKEDAPPVLPTRPTVRGRPPSLQRPGAPVPWIHRPPLPPLPPPQEERGEQYTFNLELERRVVKAEEDARRKDDDVRQKEEEIAVLRQQVEHYECQLSECEIKIKSVEEELQKQIIALQIAQNTQCRGSGSITSHHHRELSESLDMARSMATRADEATAKHQQRSCEPMSSKRQTKVDHLEEEFHRQSQDFKLGAKEVAEARPSANSMDELHILKRQFGIWKKEYEGQLRNTKAELKKRAHIDKSHNQEHPNQCQCSWWRIKVPKCKPCCWWRIKVPKCKPPKCCTAKLPCPSSCCFCNCFHRCC